MYGIDFKFQGTNFLLPYPATEIIREDVLENVIPFVTSQATIVICILAKPDPIFFFFKCRYKASILHATREEHSVSD